MPSEPDIKRTFAFFDGQNLFHASREAFGYSYPNYDPIKLSSGICSKMGWSVEQINFYTGIPDEEIDPFWHHFWIAKLAVMGSRGVRTYARQLRYSSQIVELPGGEKVSVLVGREKGIDVRIALDIFKMARNNLFDVALVFSQDQDLSEVADEVRDISLLNGRWLKSLRLFL